MKKFATFFSGLVVLAAGLAVQPAIAGDIFTPERGTLLRKQLLDIVRPRIQADLNTRVQFVVSTMKVGSGCAFLAITPQHTNGRPIDIKKTRYAADAEMMDGLITYSLLKNTNGRWREVAYVTGPTDVAYEPWPAQFGCPRAVFGF